MATIIIQPDDKTKVKNILRVRI